MFGSLLEMEDEGEYASDSSGQNFVANFKVSVACVAGARKGKGKGKVPTTQANVRTEMGNTNLQPEEPRR